MSIVVIGSFMMDMVVRTKRVPDAGETIVGMSFAKFPGGKGANQAVAAARLGGDVIMVGKLGADANGEEMRKAIEQEGIDTRYILQEDSEISGIGSVILDDTGQNRIIVVPGANLKLTPEEVGQISEVIRSADMVVMQLEMNIHTVERAAEIATNYGVPVILNPAPAQELSEQLLRNITYLTPNESELELLTGMTIHTLEDTDKAAQMLIDKGVRHVIVTLADKGALIVTQHDSQWISGFQVEAVDTVAAGDSFNGALAVQLVRGKSLAEAVKYANAAGALTVTKPGAIPSLPMKEEIEFFIDKWAAKS